jgi:hypothetical protein
MRSAVEGMEFVFCYFVATLCISLQAEGSFALSLVSKLWYDGT